MPRLRQVISKGKRIVIRIRRSKGKTATPNLPLKLGGDAYTGRRHLKRAFQKELGFSLEAFCLDCYINKLMSCQEIRDELERECRISVTRQYIWLLLKCYPGNLRSNAEAMKIRAITGRMDYKKSTSHIDYKHREIDYYKIVEKRLGKRYITNPKVKIIDLTSKQIEVLKEFARQHTLTLSDALRVSYFPNSNVRKFIVRNKEYLYKYKKKSRAVM
jgi:hypothetical protein